MPCHVNVSCECVVGHIVCGVCGGVVLILSEVSDFKMPGAINGKAAEKNKNASSHKCCDLTSCRRLLIFTLYAFHSLTGLGLGF